MILYLLKSTTCLLLLLAFYYFLLEREKMHQFNRFYLLGAVAFSFLAPLFTITIISDKPIETSAYTNNLSESNWKSYLLIFSLIISMLLLIRFIKNASSMVKMANENEQISYQNTTLVLVEKPILPFTFWNYIFINKEEFEKKRIEKELLTHELTHVKQKHTIDIVLIEMLLILFWFNPIFYFLKKCIRLNHEFLADSKVIDSHKNISEYQHLLLSKAAWNNNYYLASNFNYSLTKKRLVMMTLQSSKNKVLLKKLAVIPLVAGFTFLFAERVQAQKASKKEITEFNVLATKYNEQPKNKKVVKLTELKRMECLYAKMDDNQKKGAVSFPECPPPPKAPMVAKGEKTCIPPPECKKESK